ncbi:MAG: DUF4157 domain-containing protein [Candidatus Nitrosocosmicus sp.]
MSFPSLLHSNTKRKDNFFNKNNSNKNNVEFRNNHKQTFISNTNTNFNFLNLPIQPKLKISQPNDPLEIEAETVANRIIHMPQNEPENGNTECSCNGKCSSCQNNKNQNFESLSISRKTDSNDGLILSGRMVDKITSHVNHNSGMPLDISTRNAMESKFNFDFSSVKIHEDNKAHELSQSLSAHAFTYGNHIFFNSKQSLNDKKILAHELTHVLQNHRMSPENISNNSDTQIFRDPEEDEYSSQCMMSSDYYDESEGVCQMPEDYYEEEEEQLASYPPEYYEEEEEEEEEEQLASYPPEYYEEEEEEEEEQLASYPPEYYEEEEEEEEEIIMQNLDKELEYDFEIVKSILDNFYYSDEDESKVISILYKWSQIKYTTNPEWYPNGGEYLDKLFSKMTQEIKDVGIITEQWSSYYDLMFNHFDRINEIKRLREKYSKRFLNNNGNKEMNFGSYWWDEVKEGIVAERLYGFVQGLIDAGVGLVEGLYMLLFDFPQFLSSIANLPNSLMMIWNDRDRLWNEFVSAPPHLQGRVIGRITGELELIIFSAGAKPFPPGAKLGVKIPRLVPAEAVMASTRTAIGSGGAVISIDLVKAGESARLLSLMSQTGGIASSLSNSQANLSSTSKKKGLKRRKAPSAKGFRNSFDDTMLDLPGTHREVKTVTSRPPPGSSAVSYDSGHLIPTILTQKGGPLHGRISYLDLPALPQKSIFNQGAWAKLESQFWTRIDPTTGKKVFVEVNRKTVNQWVKKLHDLGVPRDSLQRVIDTFNDLGLYN